MRSRTAIASIVLTTVVLIGALHEVCQAQVRNPWEFGGGVGLISGSPKESQLAEQFTADYYFREHFSIGGMIQLVPPGDYAQVAGALVARYHWALPLLPDLKIVPSLGLGGLQAELRSEGVRRTDMSYYAAPGLGVDYEIQKHISLSANYVMNLHDLKLGPHEERDRSSYGVFFSVKFRPSF
jgi:hypothetical protein